MRFAEVDMLRGTAVIAMIIYHFFFDLTFFTPYKFAVTQGAWYVFARSIAITFLAVVGMAMWLKYKKTKTYKPFAKRAAQILAAAMLVTAATYIVLPQQYVRFGILHLIGVSILLGYPFLRYQLLTILTAITTILAGFYTKTLTGTYATLVFGAMPKGFTTFDYFPLLPWFGVVLLGISLGQWLYPQGKRKYVWLNLKENKVLCWCGKHALILYLIHQPILVAIINLL